jgi:ketopantoate hydroxymethyltransferase
MSSHKEVKKITTHTLLKMKSTGTKISMITAYDFSFARLFDAAGIDVILVGDSASNVMAGNETTVPITMEQMIYHAQCVVRGIDRCLVVVDMPFGSYQSNSDIAVASAIRIMKETGGHSVKLEGGEEVLDSVKRIVAAGIPTIGIGAGKDCDGQVLVMHDMLGINNEFKPRFLRQYLNLESQVTDAVQQYIRDVKSQDFPNQEESY